MDKTLVEKIVNILINDTICHNDKIMLVTIVEREIRLLIQ